MSKNLFNIREKQKLKHTPKSQDGAKKPRGKISFDGILEGIQTKSSYPQKRAKSDVIGALSVFGKLHPKLLEKMQIPDELHELLENSFSSDESKSGPSISRQGDFHSFDHKNAPEYSIVIGERGSNVFCTLVDKKRGILVSASIKNMFVSQGNWEVFEMQLDRVLPEATKLTPNDLANGRMIMVVT